MRAPLLQRRHQRLAGISRAKRTNASRTDAAPRSSVRTGRRPPYAPAPREQAGPGCRPSPPPPRSDDLHEGDSTVPRRCPAVPREPRGQAVDVDDQPSDAATRPSPSPGQPLQPLALHLDALLPGPQGHPPDSVGRARPALPSGAVPARSPVASRARRQIVGCSVRRCSRRPCPASSRSVRASFRRVSGSGAPVPLVRQPLRRSTLEPQQLATRQSAPNPP